MALNLILFYVVRDMSKSNQGFIVAEEIDFENQPPTSGADDARARSISNGSDYDGNRGRQMSRSVSRSSMALEQSERIMSNVRSISVA